MIIEAAGCLPPDPTGAVLLRSLPAVRRARDFRLYTEDGRRLTDLWQYGGRAILGHTPTAVLRELKNAASRGLFVPFPSHYEGRFIKALSRIFPGRAVRLYADDASLRLALDQAGYDASSPFQDPAFPASPPGLSPSPQGKSSPILWRPFLEDPLPSKPAAGPRLRCSHEITGCQQTAGVLVPVLPLPWAGVPRPLIIDRSLEAGFPSSGQDLISPVILAAAARSLYDLIAILPERGIRRFPYIRKALERSPWQCRGIYLTLAVDPGEEAYAALFRLFLEKGFLLPPNHRCPLILPGELSSGEEAALAALLTTTMNSRYNDLWI